MCFLQLLLVLFDLGAFNEHTSSMAYQQRLFCLFTVCAFCVTVAEVRLQVRCKPPQNVTSFCHPHLCFWPISSVSYMLLCVNTSQAFILIHLYSSHHCTPLYFASTSLIFFFFKKTLFFLTYLAPIQSFSFPLLVYILFTPFFF